MANVRKKHSVEFKAEAAGATGLTRGQPHGLRAIVIALGGQPGSHFSPEPMQCADA